MALGDVYRITVIGDYLGQTIENALHFVNVNQINQDPSGDAILARWKTLFQASYLDVCNVGYEMKALIAQRVKGGINNQSQAAPDAPSVGTVAGDGMPSYVACVASLRTFVASRSGRGRIYFGAVSEADSNGNTLAAAYRTNVLNLVVAMGTTWSVIEGANQIDVQLAVYSRLQDVGRPLASVNVRQEPATIRRRKAGRGI